jgi:hypothetical protein
VAAAGGGSGGKAFELGLLLATYVVLAAIGVMLAVIEAFLVPQRLLNGVEGLSAVGAFVGNLVVGSLGGIGTRTMVGAIVPVASWFVALGVITVYAPGGDVVIAGKLPADPGVVVTGMAMLIAGVLGGAIALVLTARYAKSRYTRRVNAPTPLT